MRQGIPTIEVTIGRYMRDWEIAEQWEKVEKELGKAREEGIKVVEETRSPSGTFRSYRVEATDVTKGRL